MCLFWGLALSALEQALEHLFSPLIFPVVSWLACQQKTGARAILRPGFGWPVYTGLAFRESILYNQRGTDEKVGWRLS